MEIGRKLYYDLATGNKILLRESRSGSSNDTTTEQDFAAYVELQGRVPSTVGEIQLEFGQYESEFVQYPTGYHVDLATQTIIFDTTPPVPVLDVVKQRKLDELTNARNNALETFTSSALGTPHTYLSRAASIPNDMLLLTSEYSFASGAHYDNQSVPWYSVEDGNTMHTGAEIIQVYLDARASVQTKMLHCGTLIGQVKAIVVSDTVTETDAVNAVNAIVW